MNYPKPWISDGAIDHLREGLAILPFQGNRGHYWIEDVDAMPETIGEGGRVRYYRSACGMAGLTRPRTPALGVGSWPICKRCAKSRGTA